MPSTQSAVVVPELLETVARATIPLTANLHLGGQYRRALYPPPGRTRTRKLPLVCSAGFSESRGRYDNRRAGGRFGRRHHQGKRDDGQREQDGERCPRHPSRCAAA